MSNICVIHYNYKRYLKQFIQLFPNICQYIVDKIILPNSTLCMVHNRDPENPPFPIPSLPYNIFQECHS